MTNTDVHVHIVVTIDVEIESFLKQLALYWLKQQRKVPKELLAH